MRGALEAAYKAQDEFREQAARGRRRGARAPGAAGELGVVLVGRPYNMHDAGVNLAIPRKLRDFYGVNVIPLDFLPIRDIDIDPIVPTCSGTTGARSCQAGDGRRATRENLHIIYITNFKCGPDSFIKHFVRQASGKPFLTLQFDGHQNDAGMMTRCEAYLDSKGILRWWSQDAADEARECREEVAGVVQ